MTIHQVRMLKMLCLQWKNQALDGVSIARLNAIARAIDGLR